MKHMNQRINGLWWKARIGYNEQNCDPEVLAKFAELIVQECAEIAYKTSWDDLVHGYGQAVIPLHLHNTIKQHFGVKE